MHTHACTRKHARTHTHTYKTQQKIPEKVVEGLKVKKPKTPTLKLLPKVHKNSHPGRPAVSSIDSPTSKISEYVDFHQQPYTSTIKSYIKDTKHFFNELDKVPASESKDSYLVTLGSVAKKKLGQLSGFWPLRGGGGKSQSGNDRPKISIGGKALSVTPRPKISINLENEGKTNWLK